MLVKRTSYRAPHYRTFSTVSTRFALAILVFVSAVLPARLFAQETPHRKVLVRVAPEYPEMSEGRPDRRRGSAQRHRAAQRNGHSG